MFLFSNSFNILSPSVITPSIFHEFQPRNISNNPANSFVPKENKFIPDHKEQSKKIKVTPETFFASKPGKFKYFNDLQEWNIESVLLIFSVLNPVKLIEINYIHSLNIFVIFFTFLVLIFDKSKDIEDFSNKKFQKYFPHFLNQIVLILNLLGRSIQKTYTPYS